MTKMKKRTYLSDSEAISLGFEINKTEKGKKKARYMLCEEQFDLIIKKRTKPNKRKFVETQKKFDKDGEVISSVEKLQSKPIDVPDGFEVIKISTSKTTGQQWVQYAPKKQILEEVVESFNFEKIIKKYIKPVKLVKKEVFDSNLLFDRLVYTDVHIGMTTNENGYSLYGGKWDEEEIGLRLDTLISHTIASRKSNVLIIDELGDFMDGWDGETTRKGHELPQNMDNEKAFDVGLGFKIKMIDSLVPYFDKIICNNICNDNHAGSFGYVVNSAFKQIVETRYKTVTVNNIRKFIDHYYYGKHCFILTHGKDSKSLKFGFKPQLDPKQIEKISNYIDQHDIKSKSDYIEFSKGDSHQKVFDESTSDSFDYYNYGALSPSSEWVQTNFKKGKSFFEFFNFKSDGNKIHNPYKFEWKIGREEEFKDFSL
jgi:hypothetical protein